MKEIALIEDSREDASAVRTLLNDLTESGRASLVHLASLQDAQEYFFSHCPDLAILDLEFTRENTTSLIFLQDTIMCPVIILSHLSHYQRSLAQQIDVKTFIRKDSMSLFLLKTVRKILFPAAKPEPELVTFPAASIHGIDESVPVRSIRFIEKVSRHGYLIHRTDGRVTLINSISFAELAAEIAAQRVHLLQPVSRGIILNVSCISRISRLENGRIEIYLVNLPERPFIAGEKYAAFFSETFLG